MVTVKSDKPVKTRTVICNKCYYELEFTGEDIQQQNYIDDITYYIVCPRPTCAEKNVVSKYPTNC